MKLANPVLPARAETDVPLEEAVALAVAYEQAVEGYVFTGGGVPGQYLDKTEYRGCRFLQCRFTGADLAKAYFTNVIFENCDFAGARLPEATLRNVCLRGCKLSGANFAAAALADVRIEDCVADYAVFSEAMFKAVLFVRTNLKHASFQSLRPRSVFAYDACNLTGAEFLHTSLNGLDLTGSDIDGISLAGPELRGAKVTALQACELARLLGVIIE